MSTTTAVAYPTQTMYWAHERERPGITNYIVRGDWRGPLDMERLAGALARVVRRHSALCAALEPVDPAAELAPDDPEALWSFVRPRRVTPSVVELEEGPEPTARTARVPFDFTQPPQVRLRVDEDVDGVRRMNCVTTHAVFDGWSRNVFWRDLARFYSDPDADDPAPDYWAVVADQHRDWASGKWARHVTAWGRVLEDMPHQGLPAMHGKLSVWPLSKAVAFGLNRGQADRLTALVKGNNRTRFSVATALFFKAIGEIFGWEEVLAALVFANRTPATRDVLGLFVNAVFLRVPARRQLDDVIDRTWKAILTGAAHGRVPFPLLRAELPLVEKAIAAQPGIMVRQQDLVSRHVATSRPDEVDASDRLIVPDRPADPEAIERDAPAAQFGHEVDLMFDCFLSDDDPLFRLTYRADRYDETTVHDLVRAFRETCASAPEGL